MIPAEPGAGVCAGSSCSPSHPSAHAAEEFLCRGAADVTEMQGPFLHQQGEWEGCALAQPRARLGSAINHPSLHRMLTRSPAPLFGQRVPALACRAHAGCLGFLDSARLQQSRARAVSLSAMSGSQALLVAG